MSKDIEAAKAQAQSNLGELGKLRKDQELNASDRGRLVTQVETLQQQLSAVQAERDKLQTQVNSRPPSTQPVADDRVKAIQRQLDDERGRGTEAASEIARLKSENALLRAGSAVPPANVSAQDLTRTFTEGVRAYELKDWPTAMKSMQAAIGMQGGVKQPPKEVRMSGTRLVPVRAVLVSRRSALRDEGRLHGDGRRAQTGGERSGAIGHPRQASGGSSSMRRPLGNRLWRRNRALCQK